MRTTIVPAQITTVEDKITGSLSFKQLLLLVAPIFGGSTLFAVLPPLLTYTEYKAALIGFISTGCCVLAIRLKNRIVLDWASILLRYSLRPTYYVFNKNSLFAREDSKSPNKQAQLIRHKSQVTKQYISQQAIQTSKAQQQSQPVSPIPNIYFSAKKGVLRVHLTETTQKNSIPSTN